MESKKHLRGVLLLLLLSPYVFASSPSGIDFFKNKPRSIAKDYYIYRYLTEKNPTSKEAEILFDQTSRMTLKLFHIFANKIDNKEYKKISQCLKMKTQKLLKQDIDCIWIGLSIYDALQLDKKSLEKLSVKTQKYKELSKILNILSKENLFEEALKDKKIFLKIANGCGMKKREELFNKELSKDEIYELSQLKSFNKTVKLFVTERKNRKFLKSLLHVKINPNLSHKTLFFLAINALNFNRKEKALTYLKEAKNRAYYRFDKDKSIFWSYLITKEEKYLQELNKSFDLNIYTIYAKEQTAKKFDSITEPTVKDKNKKYDIKNPFLWRNLLLKIKDKNSTQLLKIAENFKYKNTLGQYSFIKERADGYKISYFPRPFEEYLKNYDIKREALILAIARQESRFIPASVSTSYALGMMQFMPFLARATAKKLKISNFDLDDMFDPKIAYKFANDHLNYLEKKLSHPLLIAYAYNGGIGFTKRMLKSELFFKKGEFEPYMSMELVPYDESRRYAKKVLANYIIYMQLLGSNISLQNLIQQLKSR